MPRQRIHTLEQQLRDNYGLSTRGFVRAAFAPGAALFMVNAYFSPRTEQGVLRISIIVTIALAGFGILFGLLSGSAAILFDSTYELLDGGMTLLALLVANLIAASTSGDGISKKLAERFTMGFWHLEPVVLMLNGTLLMAAAAYALVTAISSIMAGGRRLSFDYAIICVAVSLAGALAMAIFERRANRKVHSALIALDVKSWFIASALSAACLVAFLFGFVAQGTRLDWLVPYIDPAVLAAVCLVILPMPVGTVRQAVADILLVTPADLKQHVDEMAQAMVDRYGFEGYRAYVARVGRGRQIELYFIVPTHWPAKRLEEWDHLRDEIGDAIGGESPDRWLTVVFTTDPEWAE